MPSLFDAAGDAASRVSTGRLFAMEPVTNAVAEIVQRISASVTDFWPHFSAGAVSEGCRSEGQHQHHHSAQCNRASPTGDIGIVRYERMARGYGQQYGPDKPAHPKVFPERYKRDYGEERNPAVQARRDREYDVAAVKLATG
jgi:hypothetical protein